MLRSTACAIVLAKFYMAFVLATEAPVMDGRRAAWQALMRAAEPWQLWVMIHGDLNALYHIAGV
jgi:hypothetical protein